MTTQNVIHVPGCTAADLAARFRRNAKPTEMRREFYTWNFYEDRSGMPIDVRGRQFAVIVCTMRECDSIIAVQEHFTKLGADGNVGAFLFCLMETLPQGRYVTVPKDDGHLWEDDNGRLHLPYFEHLDGKRKLGFRPVDHGWKKNTAFLGFQRLPSV